MAYLVQILCLATLILLIPGLAAQETQEAEAPVFEGKLEQNDLLGDPIGDSMGDNLGGDDFGGDDLGNLLDELELENEEQLRRFLPDGLSLAAEHTLLGGGALSEVSSLSEPSLQPTMANKIQLRFDQNKGFALAAGLRWHSLLQENAAGQTKWQNELDFEETYAGLYSLQGLWSFYIGYQYFSWGAADRISPIDILNPRDLRLSPRRQEKLSVLGAQFAWQPISWFGLEAVYLPFYRDNQIDMRAALKSPLERLQITKPLKFLVGALDFRKPSLGGRLRFYLPGQNASINFGLSYLYAPDSALTPKIGLQRKQVSVPGGSQVPYFVADKLELEREMLHHWGFDVRFAFPSWSLWLDSAFSLGPNWGKGSYAARSPKLESVAGIDFQYGPQQRFYANFQYGLRWLPDFRQSLEGYRSSGALPFELGKGQDYYRNYYLYQLNDALAGYNEGLLQRFVLNLDFPFEPQTRNIGWVVGLKLGYEWPLLGGDNAMHQLYGNPELRLRWNWQTNPSHSIQLSLALGAELFAAFDEQNAPKQSERYPSQLYLELNLLW